MFKIYEDAIYIYFSPIFFDEAQSNDLAPSAKIYVRGGTATQNTDGKFHTVKKCFRRGKGKKAREFMIYTYTKKTVKEVEPMLDDFAKNASNEVIDSALMTTDEIPTVKTDYFLDDDFARIFNKNEGAK